MGYSSPPEQWRERQYKQDGAQYERSLTVLAGVRTESHVADSRASDGVAGVGTDPVVVVAVGAVGVALGGVRRIAARCGFTLISRGRAAVDVIRSATSGRALLELTRLRRRLAPWRRDAEVSDLCEQVRELTRAA